MKLENQKQEQGIDASALLSLLDFDLLALMLLMKGKHTAERDKVITLALCAGALKSYE